LSYIEGSLPQSAAVFRSLPVTFGVLPMHTLCRKPYGSIVREFLRRTDSSVERLFVCDSCFIVHRVRDKVSPSDAVTTKPVMTWS